MMNGLTFDAFHVDAQRTSNTDTPRDKLMNGALGLAGECGECCDAIKKYLYQGHDLDAWELAKEIGDVLWYCAEIASGLGLSLEVVAKMNIEKRAERYPNGFEADRSIRRPEYGEVLK